MLSDYFYLYQFIDEEAFKIMLNSIIIIISLLILISQNILLLNEESLILGCFITFIWLLYNKTSKNIQIELNSQSRMIENSIQESFNKILISLNSELNVYKAFGFLPHDFVSLKIYFQTLNSIVSQKLINFSIQYYQSIFRKKLVFTQKLEGQISKLLALLIIKKLEGIITLKKFYLSYFELLSLFCIYKISMREYLNSI
uniref:Atp4 n=1 Tax=Pterocladia lucida TaxID=31408 RepID=A0A6M3WWD6_PTELU|nr:Atp4 [Pterocladia lucida]